VDTLTIYCPALIIIYMYIYSGILEGALRGSNAQFEPSYVLDKITVRLLEPSPGTFVSLKRFSYTALILFYFFSFARRHRMGDFLFRLCRRGPSDGLDSPGCDRHVSHGLSHAVEAEEGGVVFIRYDEDSIHQSGILHRSCHE
jgi:hypothetical protein